MPGSAGVASVGNIQQLVRPLHRRSPAAGGPLKPALISYVLEYLFPDSVPDSRHEYTDAGITLPDSALVYVDQYTGTVKTCPYDSLVWRLSHAVSCCLQWSGAAGVAHVWHEVCLEIRYRLENSLLIPGNTYYYSGTCLHKYVQDKFSFYHRNDTFYLVSVKALRFV